MATTRILDVRPYAAQLLLIFDAQLHVTTAQLAKRLNIYYQKAERLIQRLLDEQLIQRTPIGYRFVCLRLQLVGFIKKNCRGQVDGRCLHHAGPKLRKIADNIIELIGLLPPEQHSVQFLCNTLGADYSRRAILRALAYLRTHNRLGAWRGAEI